MAAPGQIDRQRKFETIRVGRGQAQAGDLLRGIARHPMMDTRGKEIESASKLCCRWLGTPLARVGRNIV